MVEKFNVDDFCPTCGQIVKEYKRKLNKNTVVALIKFSRIADDTMVIKTKDVYTIRMNGDSTAFLTHLKYLGALERVKDTTGKISNRSGEWRLTKNAIHFLQNRGKLPEYVIVCKGKVIRESPKGLYITDEKIQFKNEDQIWMEEVLYPKFDDYLENYYEKQAVIT